MRTLSMAIKICHSAGAIALLTPIQSFEVVKCVDVCLKCPYVEFFIWCSSLDYHHLRALLKIGWLCFLILDQGNFLDII